MARSSRTSQASQARAARQIKRLYEMCAMAIVAGRADLDGAAEVGFDIELPVFSVGAAGELANVHPQTLRQYDRLGLVVPQRTEGGARRYSLRDISRLAQAQQLSQEEGINLAGISNFRKRTASCAAKWSGCASRPVPACSPRTRTVASWKSSGPSARACGAGSCEPMHGSFRRANPYGRNVRKRGTIWAPGQW